MQEKRRAKRERRKEGGVVLRIVIFILEGSTRNFAHRFDACALHNILLSYSFNVLRSSTASS